jgi:diguanylate cyclase (GGDEF)-like protein/PAS domain S-box-containing protein
MPEPEGQAPVLLRRRKRGSGLPGDFRTDRRVRTILAAYLVVVTAIVAYTSTSIAEEQGSALVVNIAARQRALAERYVNDVLLVSNGFAADPSEAAEQLRENAELLIGGGTGISVHGADAEIDVDPAGDPRVVAKLEQDQRLIEELIGIGEDVLAREPGDPRFDDMVRDLRVAGALVTTVSNDAVGKMTSDTEGRFRRLVTVALALGALGGLSALWMGLSMRRAGTRRASTFRSLVHNASDLITVVDPGGAIVYQSPSSDQLVGIGAEKLIGTAFRDLVHADDQAYYDALVLNANAQPNAVVEGQFRLLHADGSIRHVDSIVSNLTSDPAVTGLVFNTRDVTDRRRLEEQLEHQAFFDSLTGLPNRAVFRDRLQHALTRAERNSEGIAVLLLDLDGFKVVNDSMGHDAGDELLVQVGRRIVACCRASDTVARLGGDEFAVLLEDAVTEMAAVQLAARLQDSLAGVFELRGREVFIGASIGVVLAGEASVGPDDLIRNADTAMYAAKTAGKGQYAVFHPEMHERTVEFFEIHADLKRALVRGELLLHYQPIVDLETGEIDGVEALVRWQHPTRGLVMPMAFIPVAEETGMIVPLGVWVLGEACRQAVAWRASVPGASGLTMNVNLSTRQLLEPDLVPRVAEVLRESGLDPAALTLEMTEGSLMQDLRQTAEKLAALKDLGIGLALDDFGTGSSSLGHLRQFPIDVLKIDKSFVDGVLDEGSDASVLVRAIVELARTLRLGTVAEGIESPAQAAALREANCERGQGYLLGRPVPPEDLERLLRGKVSGDGDRSVDASTRA